MSNKNGDAPWRELDRAVEMDELRSQLATAVEALRGYGTHKPKCGWRGVAWLSNSGGKCTCGLNAALTALEGDRK